MSKIIRMERPKRTIAESLEKHGEVVGHIKLSETDREIMRGMNTLGNYDNHLNKAKNALVRTTKKGFGAEGNMTTLLEAKSHLDEAIKALEILLEMS